MTTRPTGTYRRCYLGCQIYRRANVSDSDIIDYEKFTIGGDIDKMLLGSFVEEMDARNSDDEGHSSPGESAPLRSAASLAANGRPLKSIDEHPQNQFPSPTTQRYEMPVSRPTR